MFYFVFADQFFENERKDKENVLRANKKKNLEVWGQSDHDNFGWVILSGAEKIIYLHNLKLPRMRYFFMVYLFLPVAASAIYPQKEQLDVLIVTGGHRFDRDSFFSMFDSFENIYWTEIKHPEAIDYLVSGKIRNYDAVVFYDMPNPADLTIAQKKSISRFFKNAAPAVFLHHALVSYPFWDEFPEIIGGRFFDKNPQIVKGDTIRSGYRHDVEYLVQIADRNHPITRGLDDFVIMDEVYNKFYVKDDVVPLLITSHPESDPVIGWVNRYGRSQIVYLLNGHDKNAFENENYRRLVKNAIVWTAEATKHRQRKTHRQVGRSVTTY